MRRGRTALGSIASFALAAAAGFAAPHAFDRAHGALVGAPAPAAAGARLTTAAAENPLARSLSVARARYAADWAGLPQERLAAATIGPDSPAPAVASLARRLGLPEDESWTSALKQRLADFQRVHGLAVTSTADAETVTALDRGARYYLARIDRNLERARAIAWPQRGRLILVDAGSARLWGIADGEVMFASRIVAGRPDQQTPDMRHAVRYLEFNPYWNVPLDVAQAMIAPYVLEYGPDWLARNGYELLSDLGPTAVPVPAGSIDWQAVADGRLTARVRQKPGPTNMLGQVKFMFPNPAGIYLHDTSNPELFAANGRHQSYGCVRVEQIDALIRFVGAARPPAGPKPVRVDLSEPVPVELTYLTVTLDGRDLRFLPDPYGRDMSPLARASRT